MSNHLTSLAYKLDVGSLLRKSVLVLLADKASDDGSGIWASKQTMADELCCSKQAVWNVLQEFMSEGLLIETGRKTHRNGYTVTYALIVSALDAIPRVKRWSDNPSTVLTGKSDRPGNVNDEGGQPRLPKPSRTPLSEAKASGVAADPVKELVDLGVSLLTSTGTTEKNARSLIGKWRKSKGDGEVLTALIDCRARAITQPIEWLEKRFGGAAAKYVSASGWEYRGDLDAVEREAKRRHDMDTYWQVQIDKRKAREAA